MCYVPIRARINSITINSLTNKNNERVCTFIKGYRGKNKAFLNSESLQLEKSQSIANNSNNDTEKEDIH